MITDRQMQTKASGTDQWLSEEAPKGHGRFMGCITRSGDRLFYFRYTGPDKKRSWISIGAYDPNGRYGLTLKDARTRAGELSKLYQNGIIDLKNHLQVERELAEAKRQAEQVRLEAERQAAAAEAVKLSTRVTVHTLFERWVSVDLIRRKDQGQEVRRMFKKDVLPTLGNLAVEDVRKGHVTAVTDALLARGVSRMAKLIFSLNFSMRGGNTSTLINALGEFQPKTPKTVGLIPCG